MKLKTLLALMLCTSIVSSPAFAGEVLSAKHKLTAVEAHEGGTLLTFNLQIANGGTQPVSNIKLIATVPLIQGDPAGTTQLIDLITPGNPVRLTWTIPSSLPPDQLRPGVDIPFCMEVSSSDENGNSESSRLCSTGGDL